MEHYPDPKNSPLGPQKVKNDPQIKSKSDVRIEGTIGYKSCVTIYIDTKTVFEPYPDPENSPLGPQNVKNDPKIRSNSDVRIEGIIENESC